MVRRTPERSSPSTSLPKVERRLGCPKSPQPWPELCFDLENRPSAYWYDGQTTSEITAICWKWSDEDTPKTLLLRHDDYFEDNEGKLLPGNKAYVLFRGELSRAGLVYGHNIRRHDLPIFQASLVRRQLPPLEPVMTCDTLKDLPKLGGMARSLDNLASMYGLPGKKFHMAQHDWERANQLTEDGLALARKRVESDVLLQEKLRAKLLELHLLRPARMWNP